MDAWPIDVTDIQEGWELFARFVGVTCLLISLYMILDRDFILRRQHYRVTIMLLCGFGLVLGIYPALSAWIYWVYYAVFGTAARWRSTLASSF